jgi:hypothetical protein
MCAHTMCARVEKHKKRKSEESSFFFCYFFFSVVSRSAQRERHFEDGKFHRNYGTWPLRNKFVAVISSIEKKKLEGDAWADY